MTRTRAAAVASPLRVLVLSSCPLAPSPTGPAIRARALAGVLGSRFEVTLAAPGTAPHAPVEGAYRTTVWTRATVPRLIRRYDVVVSQGMQYPARHALRANGRRPFQVFDLYDPVVFENLEAGRGPEHLGRLTALLLRRADLVLCASERQRDLWTGGLYVSGDPAVAAAATRIGVVPFGHDGNAPQRRERAGLHPAIGERDRLVLWGGGVWSWLDPETAIRAMGHLADADPTIKLLFLAGRHPAHAGDPRDGPGQARAVAADLGVLDRNVLFHHDWVPYERRVDYLLRADLAVCTSPESSENRFSFRARLVDAVWAGLPVVCTRGGSMADFVERHGVGRTVAAGDPQGLAKAILEALAPDAQRVFRERLRGARDELRWDRCARPLVEFCERVARGEYARPAEPRWRPWLEYLEYKLPALAGRLSSRGGPP